MIRTVRTAFRSPTIPYMVHASDEVLWQEHIPDISSIYWEVVRYEAITAHITLCTKVQAGYQVDELWGYSAEGQDSPEYISVQQVELLAEIHIGCQQPNAEITQTLGEDTECQKSIYGRLLGRETRLLMALVS